MSELCEWCKSTAQSIHPGGPPSSPTLLGWVQRHEIDSGMREGVTSAEAQRVKELRRANEILKLASAFFAQAEHDRRLKS